MAITLSLFFALGIFQISLLSQADQSGLETMLFGQAAALRAQDIEILSYLALLTLAFVLIFFHHLKLYCFDSLYAQSLGFSRTKYELLLASVLVLSIVLGLQLVGVVLMAALLIIPAACASFWTKQLKIFLFVSGVIGALSGIAGTAISSLALRMPTGPWIVIVAGLFFLLSVLLGTKGGFLVKLKKRHALRLRAIQENILRAVYKFAEAKGDFHIQISFAELLSKHNFTEKELNAACSSIEQNLLIVRQGRNLALSETGLARAQMLTRAHRLWELYLTENLNIAQDHVHDSADAVEHFITLQLEERLRSELNEPQKDPHGRDIP